jgi:hypothetical protein
MDSPLRLLYCAFEDHFMVCSSCTLKGYCPEGQRLRGVYDQAARARAGAPPALPQTGRKTKAGRRAGG